jgi:hypothetical protein
VPAFARHEAVIRDHRRTTEAADSITLKDYRG